jgi:aminoglycoside phosphotransferase (APT) family kinase protein
MSTPSYSWPEELFSSDRATSWLRSELGEGFSGPTEILYSKQWGVTAVFEDQRSARQVIFKGGCLSVAAHGPVVHRFLAETVPEWVPSVLATRVEGDIAWTVFEPIDGRPLEEELSTEAFAAYASTLASIQTAVAMSPIPPAIPRSPVGSIPVTLERFRKSTQHHLEEWQSQDSGPEAVSADQVDDYLRSIHSRVSAAADGLAQCGWPDSIDHVDLNVSNALITVSGLTIIDWEEAVVGFPACSLDRLMDDAAEFDDWQGEGLSPTATAVAEAYADHVPWGPRDTRRDIIEQAIRLNRIAFAGQALDFWQARGKAFGHPKLAAICVDRIADAWA